MEKIIKKIIQKYLKILTQIAIYRYNPEIIAIAGSTNKHIIKKEIEKNLKKFFFVRTGPKKYNAEIGIPLTVFGLESKGETNKIKKWFFLIIKMTKTALKARQFPQKIILEMGISRPQDMDYLLSMVKPKIVILTNINAQYLDNFGDLDKQALEYKKLIKSVPSDGLVILNNDDNRIRKLNIFSDAKVLYYGKRKGSDFKILKIYNHQNKQEYIVAYNNIKKKISSQKFGIHHVYSKLITEAIKKYYKIDDSSQINK